MKRVFFLAMGLVAVLGWARPASADDILFDIDGVGGLAAISVDKLDWQPGNTLLKGSTSGSPTTAVILYQANLGFAIERARACWMGQVAAGSL